MFKQSKTVVSYNSYTVWRNLTTSSASLSSSNHYDALGLTPKASQGDIKTAYYELSKVYHPDKSKDEESLKKFRAITEAYEVLGNIKTKTVYDRGLMGSRDGSSGLYYEPEPESKDPTVRFYKSRAYRHVVPTMDGRTPVYDFDAWSREHYGDILKKKQYAREFVRKREDKYRERIKSSQQENMIYILVSLGGLFLFLMSNAQKNYDVDLTRNKKTQMNARVNVEKDT